MDFKNIVKLLPEFLELFKGKDLSGLTDILPSLGNSGKLKNIFEQSGKFTKYLPLLPLLGKINEEGFKGLLNNTEDVSAILSLLLDSDNKYAKMLQGVDTESILKFLPLLTGFLNKKKDKKESIAPLSLPQEPEVTVNNTGYLNPLAYIADIADKDIIYALNKYIYNDISV